jgi:hypothetical protein
MQVDDTKDVILLFSCRPSHESIRRTKLIRVHGADFRIWHTSRPQCDRALAGRKAGWITTAAEGHCNNSTDLMPVGTDVSSKGGAASSEASSLSTKEIAHTASNVDIPEPSWHPHTLSIFIEQISISTDDPAGRPHSCHVSNFIERI